MGNERRDEELLGWQAEWATLGGNESFAATMVERAARDGRKLRLSAAGEVLAAVFSMVVSMGVVVRTHGALPVVAIVVVIQVFTGAWLAHFFDSRRTLFDGEGRDTAGFVALTRERLEASRRWTLFGRRWMQILGAIVVPWCVWMGAANAAMYRAEPWRAVVGFGGALVIFVGAYAWLGHKERATRREREALEREIAAAEMS